MKQQNAIRGFCIVVTRNQYYDLQFWNEFSLGLNVVFKKMDENGLAAFEKPTGLLCHPNSLSGISRALI